MRLFIAFEVFKNKVLTSSRANEICSNRHGVEVRESFTGCDCKIRVFSKATTRGVGSVCLILYIGFETETLLCLREIPVFMHAQALACDYRFSSYIHKAVGQWLCFFRSLTTQPAR